MDFGVELSCDIVPKKKTPCKNLANPDSKVTFGVTFRVSY